jgi:hypothetical protein
VRQANGNKNIGVAPANDYFCWAGTASKGWLTLGSLATRASTTNRGGREQVRARREAAEKIHSQKTWMNENRCEREEKQLKKYILKKLG